MDSKNDIRILAYESSCDETSTAVVKNGREVESMIIATQIKSHQRFGGVVPEVASRHHIEVISQITAKALTQANVTWQDIDAIAVTYGPGLVGALLIGVSAAKAASMATGIPLIGVDHIMGHIMAAQLTSEIDYPALALQVSGGHTEIVLLQDPTHFEIVGDTRDDAAGEAYDKIGRVLGVNYPAGKTIDKWAHEGQDTFNFPRAMMEDDNYDFSFSGLKSAFINTCHHADQIHQELNKYDLAASFQAAVVDVLATKTIRAIKEYQPKTFIMGGGVAANQGLRERMEQEIENLSIGLKPKVILPELKLCGDNAAMIGAAAYNLYNEGKFADLTLNANPSLELPYADKILY
ncbi:MULTISPECIES: tRNA (adenosine(37)-N6)-threonylcarbamoyltransferase complex transferase subunit TsaD [unclassified Lactobacillus]|uniref:tRNA (adenosine(37)-N6)-threonylcarbamoyltransferase complex transferase subunit TsaD n=1 Tax=unclassified Lactobacillus TaxID=2620435 RepID=UPI000EFD8705|nr:MULTISPECIES: tRNA (adenosine(37)-N6)-threonylcarbamoyltransferase complex transferase subunit TsaD [unclassified Lactobacillus]RMC23938.1 tRNA (adenosine(37)-N6)-threonylcarbamoyltransferase complex transferase subunit TsaD [Lactobacillus sp. ESL0247]RMC28309.1 tRNA (adenosine(37)-N6)-threonylcarbamoyltransferase complex transferase subunit TsaD [Lactobacillus sp. ESL0246]RMC31035.1 tRNA (adenosine(37)-N6)-threonylcarbamoyltransferase complex transferase subunit TsaD [Lactobacillus sp. ESL02